jgi:hypothetical protein
MSGELAAGHQADVKLKKVVRVWWVGQRERAASAFLEQNIHVLASEELQALIGRQFEVDEHHLRRCARHFLYPCWQGPDRNILKSS